MYSPPSHEGSRSNISTFSTSSVGSRKKAIKVLVVENNGTTTELLLAILDKITSLQITVQYTEDRKEAKRSIQSCMHDLYFVNEQFLPIMEHAQWGATNPIILYGDGEMEDVSLERGAADYIFLEDFTARKLKRSIKYALARGQLKKETYTNHELKEAELNSLIHQQNKIIEGIKYAKLIQDTLLSSRADIRELFGDFLIHYAPRDIVSGDFYFIKKKENKRYVAVADCTGHGVPGAFMSVFCNDALKRAVDLFDRPKDILNHVKAIIEEEFLMQEGNSIIDGMDIALVMVDDLTQTIVFSGAYRPLVVASGNELTTYKGDKVILGVTGVKQEGFTEQLIPYKRGDRLYMFSDGFPDQFGGSHCDKFGTKKLIRLLGKTSKMSLASQQKKLIDEFEDWKGIEDQIDDILVLGVEL